MSLTQLHYTSAPPGPDGSGFRFTAVSPGVPQSLLREVEQVIGYEPPREAPPRPTEAELADFPTAFSHTRLADGSRVLVRTVYTGADYSGRWGNFYAHAVHLPSVADRLPGGALPITAWDSPQWSSSPPAGGTPPPLERFRPAEPPFWVGLEGFIAARARWLAGLLADVRALHEDGSAAQIVIVERSSVDVARWIALAGAVLPSESAQQLTFTTYTRRPQQAGQQIIGILPETRPVLADGSAAQRYRVHDCAGPAPRAAPLSDGSGADPWAGICARIMLSGRMELFREVAALPSSSGPFDTGRLAATALRAGLALGAADRGSACQWLLAQADRLDAPTLGGLLAALCAPGGDRDRDESAVLVRLHQALADRLEAPDLEPLTALILRQLVCTPGTPLPPSLCRTLPPQLRAELAEELRDDLARALRAAVATGPEAGGRPLVLLGVAELLAVDCAEFLPAVARQLSLALLADRAPDTLAAPALGAALANRPELHRALLLRLDEAAADDPATVARRLAASAVRVELPAAWRDDVPHLAMCLSTGPRGAAAEDRPTCLHTLLRTVRPTPFEQPLVLRTAMALVWDRTLPTVDEALQLLAETGPAVHRAAGTWSPLVEAALAGPAAEDAWAPVLAGHLLTGFDAELGGRQREALRLLQFAGALEDGSAEPGWVDRVLALRPATAPSGPGGADPIGDRAGAALARALLGGRHGVGADGAELSRLAGSGDRLLLTAYAGAARSDRLRARLAAEPALVAACFLDWNSFSGADPLWDRARAELLDTVLRRAVRALSAAETEAVELRLARNGPRWVELFREWNRPSALSRFAKRLGGRSDRSTEPVLRWNDVEPPRREGDR